MPILFKCELCRARLSISRSKAGKIGTCPKCGEPIHIPRISDIQQKQKPAKKKPKPKLASVSTDSEIEVVHDITSENIAPKESLVMEAEVVDEPQHETKSSSVSASLAESFSSTESPAKSSPPPLLPQSTGSLKPMDSVSDFSDSDEDLWNEDSSSKSHPTATSEPEQETGSVLNSILIPRWVIYFQAGLIGVVAATFFIFGMMVGSFTSSPESNVVAENQFRIGGSIFVDDVIDEGAVVIALPAKSKPDPRPDTKLLHPDSFEPVNNDSIALIRELGGDVVRANRDGQFEVVVEGPAEYFLLVISKRKRRRSGVDLEKQQMAEVGRFFLPFQPLVEGKQFVWRKIKVTSSRNLKPINF